VATVTRNRLSGCDGFRVESPEGLIGWVEETWLGPAGEPSALAVRMLDGRRGLALAEEVEAVAAESQLVVVRHGELRELDAPRIEVSAGDGGRPGLFAASWRTTGELLEPPPPPRLVRRALLALRPWRLAPLPPTEVERPLWQTILLLYASLAFLVLVVIGLTFLAAYLVTGSAY
jgi:hypothetical protein